MALSPARYSHGLLPPVPPHPMPTREPTPKNDASDNDGMQRKPSLQSLCLKSVPFNRREHRRNQRGGRHAELGLRRHLQQRTRSSGTPKPEPRLSTSLSLLPGHPLRDIGQTPVHGRQMG